VAQVLEDQGRSLIAVNQALVVQVLQWWFPSNNQVVTDHAIWAFGDTHGAFGEFGDLLKQVGLVDGQLNWSGGKAHLVSTGDVLDRGPHPRKILDLMMKLEKQAEQAGGKFHLVLGNHEVMILIGDLRYVSDAEYLEFAADETAAMREKYFRQYTAYHQPRNSIDPDDVRSALEPQQLQQQFDQEYPDGLSRLELKAILESGEITDTETLNTEINQMLRLTFDITDTRVRATFRSASTGPNLLRPDDGKKSLDITGNIK
jgi:hypothetical protein